MNTVDIAQYYARLKLDPSQLGATATLSKLCALQEAHIAQIPFENTALHGVHGGPPLLDVAATADKILLQNRGGFCYEVNCMFGQFLQQLGYQVTYTPAYVYKEHLADFLPLAMHVTLVVRTQDGTVLSDVGFGEPWLHPLRYEDEYIQGVEQKTPEGMCTRIVREGDDSVVLLWCRGDKWVPRLKWSYKASTALPGAGATMDDFKPGYGAVLSPKSPFVKGLIVCKLTRDTKTTLAGNTLKITKNRFQPDESVSTRTLPSVEEARKVLEDEFGIPFEKSAGLVLNIKGEDTVWSTM